MRTTLKTNATPFVIAVIGLSCCSMAAWIFHAESSKRSAILAAISEFKLTIEPQRIDLGVVGSEKIQSVSFAIANNTKHTAESIIVHESCGCTVAKNKPVEIKSSETAVLDADFNPKGRSGPSKVFMIFEYRLQGRRQQTLLTITADVVDGK